MQFSGNKNIVSDQELVFGIICEG